MTLQEKAKALVALRAKMNEIDKGYEEIIAPLKIEKELLQTDIIQEMKGIGFKAIKTEEGATVSIAERPTLRVENEEKIIKYLKKEGMKDLYKVQIVKPLFKSYAEARMKKGIAVPGTIVEKTEYISVRNSTRKPALNN